VVELHPNRYDWSAETRDQGYIRELGLEIDPRFFTVARVTSVGLFRCRARRSKQPSRY